MAMAGAPGGRAGGRPSRRAAEPAGGSSPFLRDTDGGGTKEGSRPRVIVRAAGQLLLRPFLPLISAVMVAVRAADTPTELCSGRSTPARIDWIPQSQKESR
jgi:hypothetical protein